MILNAILPLLPSCGASPLPLDVGYLFFGGINGSKFSNLKTVSIYYHTVFESQESEGILAEWFWIRASHKAVTQVSLGAAVT